MHRHVYIYLHSYKFNLYMCVNFTCCGRYDESQTLYWVDELCYLTLALSELLVCFVRFSLLCAKLLEFFYTVTSFELIVFSLVQVHSSRVSFGVLRSAESKAFLSFSFYFLFSYSFFIFFSAEEK